VLVGEVPNMMVMVDILCFRAKELPMNYLEMPLGLSFKSLSV
jgi:hypothetical protein